MRFSSFISIFPKHSRIAKNFSFAAFFRVYFAENVFSTRMQICIKKSFEFFAYPEKLPKNDE